MNISLIVPVHGNPIALKRTLESMKGLCNEVIVGDLLIFSEDREAIRAYASEYNIKFVRYPFNSLFLRGFSEVLNELAAHAKNDMIIYMNVGEIMETPIDMSKFDSSHNCYCFNHATDPHKWYRIYNKEDMYWSGRIHEELRGRVVMKREPVFQMADTEKDMENPFKAKVLDSVKELCYFLQYLKLVDDPEGIGATNLGWVKYAKDGYQHIKDRMEAKGDLLKAFQKGNYILLMDYINNSPDLENERFQSSKLVSFQTDGNRVGTGEGSTQEKATD